MFGTGDTVLDTTGHTGRMTVDANECSVWNANSKLSTRFETTKPHYLAITSKRCEIPTTCTICECILVIWMITALVAKHPKISNIERIIQLSDERAEYHTTLENGFHLIVIHST